MLHGMLGKSSTALLSIQLKHAYYPRMEAQPAYRWQGGTMVQDFVRKGGLILRESPNAIHLFPDEDKLSLFTQLAAKKEAWILDFYLYSPDPNWISISELPLNYNPQQFILAPPRAELLPPENNLNLLLERSLAESKMMALDGPISPNNILPAQTGQSSNTLASGVTPSQAQNMETESPHFFTQKGIPPIAKISLQLPVDLLQQWQEAFQNAKKPQGIHYHYQISNRQAHWFYWLCPQQSAAHLEVKKMEILSEDPEISFTGPEEFRLEGGQKAYVFYSNQPLPILKKSPFRFELLWEKVDRQNYQLQYEGQKHQTLTRILPVASPQHLQLRSLKGKPCVAADIICQI